MISIEYPYPAAAPGNHPAAIIRDGVADRADGNLGLSASCAQRRAR
jgi:hypothetical protein